MIGFFWAFWATEVVGSRVGASRVGPAFAEILRKEEELSRCARGVGCSDSTALCGPSRCRWLVFGPMGRGLRWWWVCLVFWALWATEVVGSWVGASRVGPAFAEILRKEEELSRCARGVGCSDSTALCGPVPLPLGDVRGDVADFWGQAGLWMDCGLGTGWFGSVGVAPRDRSCARREARGRYGFFALCAKGGG
jgi:hypothetical protein